MLDLRVEIVDNIELRQEKTRRLDTHTEREREQLCKLTILHSRFQLRYYIYMH